MGVNRSFAYNSGAPIAGTTQVGSIAVGPTGSPISYGGGVAWWPGPLEDNGYVICHTSGDRTAAQGAYSVASPTIGFYRSALKTEASFIALAGSVYGTTFTTGASAAAYITAAGNWSSWLGIEGSLVFNGTSQTLGISPGIIFGAGAYTVEGWFYNTSNFNNKGILGSPVTNPVGCMNLHFSSNTLIQSDKNGGGGAFSFTMASAISTNAWHYFIYNRNSNGVVAVYIDGVRCTATSTDNLNYNTATDTIGRDYAGYWPGYWTNMRITIGTAVYDSSQTTQTNPTGPLSSLANTKYLMLGAVVTTDSSGTQTVTNNNGVTQNSSLKPI